MAVRDCPAKIRRQLPLSFLLLALLCLALIAVPGCGGCTRGANSATTAAAKKKKEDEEKAKAEKDKKKKKAEKPKDDFEPLAIRMLPSDDPTLNVRTPPVHGKPGHWIAMSETLKANNFDFPGELATFAEMPATNQPIVIEDTTQRLSIWCPAILPKGQAKRIETLFYLPRRDKGLNAAYSLRSELRGARGGRSEVFATVTSSSLKDYQFLVVVLSSNPAAYSHLDKLRTIKASDVPAPGAATDSVEPLAEPMQHYFVVRPNCERTVPLASHPLAWTTTAFVIWDDINPAALTNLQQEALLDWIHWGGQLVISGPSSLDKLRGSFLGPYLPGEVVQSVSLEQAAFDELNANFSLQRDPARVSLSPASKTDSLRRINVLPERPMLGVELKLHPAAQTLAGTGGLVVERRIGGGRIAVTSFPLTDVRIKQWKNFDGFFNSVLLRRPAREFSQSGYSQLAMNWAEPKLRTMTWEPRMGSTLRYFSRDVGFLSEDSGSTAPTTPPVAVAPAAPAYNPRTARFPYTDPDTVNPRIDTSGAHPATDDWHLAGYQSTDQAGVAAWNDEGSASRAARLALTEAAGIEIPRAEFVLQVLGIYLLVLVPLNWLLFWLIGRVEWAWIAAPIIAVVGAAAVIRLAQLDIGFARNRTEIAVLEMQGGYERAHLTRYTALYTSLSSNYTAAFSDQASLALPFPGGPRNESLLTIATYTDVLFRRDKEVALSGVQVYSNETGMIHSEQMLALGKSPKVVESVELRGDANRGFSVLNNTDLTIRDIGIIRRVDNGQLDSSGLPQPRLETAFVAKLEPANSSPLKFSPLQDENIWLAEWNQSKALAKSLGPDADRGRVKLHQLAQLAAQRLRLLPGDVRLIGWTDDPLPGMQLRPEAPQNSTYTLVLAHLVRGALPPVRADRNVAEDYLDPTVDLDAVPDSETPAEAPTTGS